MTQRPAPQRPVPDPGENRVAPPRTDPLADPIDQASALNVANAPDRAAPAAGPGLRGGAVPRGRRQFGLAVLGVVRVRRRRDHRQHRRGPGPQARPGHRVRQADRPDRRQGPDRHRAGGPVDARPAELVDHHRDPGPRDRGHPAAVLGHPPRRHPGQPRRQGEDPAAVHCHRPLRAAAVGPPALSGRGDHGRRRGADAGDRADYVHRAIRLRRLGRARRRARVQTEPTA